MASLARSVKKLNSKLPQIQSCVRRSVRSAAVPDVNCPDAKPFEEIPGPSGKYNLPVFGAAFHFKPFTDVTVETIYKLFDSLLDTYGPIVRARLGEWTVLVEDLADIETIIKNEGKYPFRQSLLINLLFSEEYGAPKTLVDLQGEEWQKFRSPLNARMMRPKSAQVYLPVQNEVADNLVSRMKKPFSPDELVEIFYRYACESISVVTFNKRLGYLDSDIDEHPEKVQALRDIRTVLQLLKEGMALPPFVLRSFPLKIKKRYFESANRLHMQTKEYYKKALADIKEQQELGSLDTRDNFMLSLLMTDKLDADQMASVAFSLFTAGTDSTAQTLQMVLYNLARHPEKQQKLYEEIANVLGFRQPLTEERLGNMSYLQACLKESYRLIYPISNGVQRYLPTDVVLQGYKIPAGTSILMMNQRAVKNPKYFPDPNDYIPERWLRDEHGKRETPIPTTALLPFGTGPRQCLGKRFAEQEIYLALTKILQHFRVSLVKNHEEIEVLYTPFAGTRRPIKFVLEERG